MKIDNLGDLRVLVATANAGSLTAAGKLLGLTPAAASAMLKRLETQLGARLFERSTRAIRLTDAGQTLLDYAVRALELLQEGEAQVTQGRGGLVGTLRVAAPSDLTRSLLLPWFDDFIKAQPGIQLALSVSDRVQDVLRDQVDVALRYGDLHDARAATNPGLVARLLHASRRVLCASPAYLARHGAPASLGDLAHHNCLTFHVAGKRYAKWRFRRDGQWTDVAVAGDRTADDAALAHQWALAGIGITYKAELDMLHDLRSGALVSLLPLLRPAWTGEDYPLYAVLPSNRFIPGRVRAFIDFIASRLANATAPSVEVEGVGQPLDTGNAPS
jgi:DNA-binding transcriptional LysR family regulator